LEQLKQEHFHLLIGLIHLPDQTCNVQQPRLQHSLSSSLKFKGKQATLFNLLTMEKVYLIIVERREGKLTQNPKKKRDRKSCMFCFLARVGMYGKLNSC